MEYIAPRSMTVISLSGRSVRFEKGVPTFAPPQMHAELISHGIVPTEEIPEVEKVETSEPQTMQDREESIFAAFERIAMRDKREDFTAAGFPHNAVLAKELGWSGVTSKERDSLWAKFVQSKSAK